jgi:hypothetical protein
MLNNKTAITIFLTEENVKKFIHFIFDNNLMKTDCCRDVFDKFIYYYGFTTEPTNSYYSNVLCHLKSRIESDWLCEALYLFPDFLDFYSELTDLTNADLQQMLDIAKKHLNTYRRIPRKKSKNEEEIMQVIQDVATAQGVSAIIIANQALRALKEEECRRLYDEIAHTDFLTEKNVKQFTINDIFETFEHEHLQRLFVRFLQKNYMNLRQYNHTVYWYFCEHLKYCPIEKYHIILMGSPTYKTFVANHVLQRKTIFMAFCDEVFATYDYTNTANNVFANEYLARWVCNYV